MPDERADIEPKIDPKLLTELRKMEINAESRRQARAQETKRLELEAGWFGRVIGTKYAPYNIAFLIITIVLICGFVVLFAFPADRVEYWKLIAPVLTLGLGYLFGKNSKE